MKTKILISTVCLMLAVFAFGQDKQFSKAENKALKIDSAIQAGSYEIIVNQANPMSGKVWHLTTDYSIRISGDSSYVYLPYFGRAYSAPFNGEGGIKISNSMDNYKAIYKKGKSYLIDFTAKGMNDTYRFSITLWTNGRTSINVSCNNRQAINYFGELKLPGE